MEALSAKIVAWAQWPFFCSCGALQQNKCIKWNCCWLFQHNKRSQICALSYSQSPPWKTFKNMDWSLAGYSLGAKYNELVESVQVYVCELKDGGGTVVNDSSVTLVDILYPGVVFFYAPSSEYLGLTCHWKAGVWSPPQPPNRTNFKVMPS